MKTPILLAGAAAIFLTVPAFAQIATGGSAGTMAGPQLGATPPGAPPPINQPPSPIGTGASASGGVNTEPQIPASPQAGASANGDVNGSITAGGARASDQSGYSVQTSKSKKKRSSSGSSAVPDASAGASANGDVSTPPRF